MGDAKELQPVPQGPPPKVRIASSLADAAKGEIVVLDEHGNAVSRRRILVRAWTNATLRFGIVGLSAGSLIAMHHPLLALGLWSAFSGAVLFRNGRARGLRTAIALVGARRYEEAFAAFEELDQRDLPTLHRVVVKKQLATLDWLLGRRESALVRYDLVVDLARAHRRARVTYWQALFERATLRAVLGRVDEARSLLAEAGAAPDGELFTILRQDLAITVALHGGDAATLPDHLVLHDWARAALGRTRFGLPLVRLAWAFARVGDVDMAKHVLAESFERLDHPVDRVDPALGAWMEQRVAEWGLTRDESP